MTKLGAAVSGSALASLLVFGVMSAATSAGDLTRYRDFQLGTDLPTIAKLTSTSPSHTRVIHRRPALIQELQWHPQPLGWSSMTEPAQEVIFSFYDGVLFRIVVSYDRHETEGLTTNDLIESISAAYGVGAKPPTPSKPTLGTYGDQEEIVARWEDPQHRFDLVRSSYGPSFRLVGVLKRLEAPAQAAALEAARLDEQEAPQREAARVADQGAAEKAKLEKARLVNKPKFRP